MVLGEEGDHLLDLHDLLRGAAEEAEERFAEGLAEEAEAGKCGEAAREVRVAAPRERIGEDGEIAVGAEVGGERGRGGGGERGRRGPLEVVRGVEAQPDEMRAEAA